MTTSDARNALKDAFRDLNNALQGHIEYNSRDPLPLLQELEEGHSSLSEPINGTIDVNHEPVEEVFERTTSWDEVYGVDGSVTRALQFGSGLTICASVAKTAGSGKHSTKDVEKGGDISVMVYVEDEDFVLDIEERSVDGIRCSFSQFPYGNFKDTNLSEWIEQLVRTQTESEQVKEVSRQQKTPVFRDGAIYPTRLISWTIDAQVPPNKRPVQPGKLWSSKVTEIMENFITCVDSQLQDNMPYVGIVKTPGSSHTIDSIKQVVDYDVPYGGDRRLFSDALERPESTPDKKIISYTSWIQHKEYMRRKSRQTLFDGHPDIELKNGDPIDYMPAVFYVRPPGKNYVLRAEVPRLLVGDSKEERQKQQGAILREISKSRREPKVIQRADKLVKIRRQEENYLKNLISDNYQGTVNEEREP